MFLLLGSKNELTEVFHTGLFAIAYRKLEDVLSDAGFLVRMDIMRNFRELSRTWNDKRSLPYGVVLYKANEKRLRETLPELERLTTKTARVRVPVVIDWDMGFSPLLPQGVTLLSRPNIATTLARTLAGYLFEHGHRHALFFVDYADMYDERRSALWSISNFIRVRAEIKHLDPAFDFRLAIKTRRGEMVRPFHDIVQPELAARLLSKYTPTPASVLDDEIYSSDSIEIACAGALNQGPWIFQKDSHAAAALEWARAHRRRVPQDISVIGLQNDPRFFQLGISRCEPDWEGIGYLMAHAVIGDFPIEKTHKGFMRTRAKVLAKLTTA